MAQEISAFQIPSLTQQQSNVTRQGMQQMMVMLDKAERGYVDGSARFTTDELSQLDAISKQLRGRGFASQSAGGGLGTFAKGAIDAVALGLPTALGIFDEPETAAEAKSFQRGEFAGMAGSLLFGGGAALRGVGRLAAGKAAPISGRVAKAFLGSKPKAVEEGAGLLTRAAAAAKGRPIAVGAGYGAVAGGASEARDEYGDLNSAGQILSGALAGAGTGAALGAVTGGLLRKRGEKLKTAAQEAQEAAAKAPAAAKSAGGVKKTTSTVKAADDATKAADNVADEATDFGQSVREADTTTELKQGRAFRERMESNPYGQRFKPSMERKYPTMSADLDDDVMRYANSADGSRQGLTNFFERATDEELAAFGNEYVRIKGAGSTGGREVRELIQRTASRGKELNVAARQAADAAKAAERAARAEAQGLTAKRKTFRKAVLENEGLTEKSLKTSAGRVGAKRAKAMTEMFDDIVASDASDDIKNRAIDEAFERITALPKSQQMAEIGKFRAAAKNGKLAEFIEGAPARPATETAQGLASTADDALPERFSAADFAEEDFNPTPLDFMLGEGTSLNV